MTVRIRVADDPETVDALLRVRHDVLVGGSSLPARADGRVVGHHDALPGTTQLVAEVESHVVGGLRIDWPGPVPSAADERFEFDPYVPDRTTAASASMLCVLPEFQEARGVNENLWKMASYVAERAGMTHIKGSARPDLLAALIGVGFEVLTETVHHDEAGQDAVPLLLDLGRTNQAIRDFIARQELGPFADAFDRLFVPAGETVIERGRTGEEAYFLITGEARVDSGHGRSFHLARGELFGELALLTDRPRTATVTAHTDLELMGLSRRKFHDQMQTRPAAATAVLEALALRLAESADPAPPAR